jgi:hypothetical protein
VVRGAWHDFQVLNTAQGMAALAIQIDDHRIQGSNDL